MKYLKAIYRYAVHKPHRESDWKLGFILGVALLVAISMNF